MMRKGTDARPGRAARLTIAVTATVLAGCASPRRELEQVAKDWCLTIRASQVIPVYPLSEDIQPGDVFLVPTSIRDQARDYKRRGFLPLDQLVTRIGDLPYAAFYGDAYWQGSYGAVPHDRPLPAVGAAPSVRAPRAAFPSYTFEVDRSTGLEIALPIHGVPVGLGILGARRARGSVTIRDAYTYAVDAESLVRLLRSWAAAPDVRFELANVAAQTARPLFLRVVTRVFLAGGVTVSLTNLDAIGAGIDAAAAPELELLDLAVQSPEQIDAAVDAYRKALGALADATPGAAFRISQASRRTVTLDEEFDRPLVIGYLGFDVLVSDDGRLSAPIPSFAALSGDESVLKLLRFVVASAPDRNTELIDAWLDADRANLARLAEYLGGMGHAELDPSDLLEGEEYAALRAAVVARFDLAVH
ncbi:MAG: hypothetical protein IPM29_03410 [Planctomycetes bacterium]|nr:hypothetical protein [Planctomycetota bacterium]